MASIAQITAGDTNARTKINAAITEANKVDDKADTTSLSAAAFSGSTADLVEGGDKLLMAAEERTKLAAFAGVASEADVTAGASAELVTVASQVAGVVGLLPVRPGEVPGAFTNNTQGGLSNTADGTPQTNAYGVCQRLVGAGRVTHRQALPVSGGENWYVSVSLNRHTDPSDPSGDTVEVLVRWRSETSVVSTTRMFPQVNGTPLTTADGLVVIEFTIGASPDATFSPPDPSVVTGSVYVRTYGSDGETDINSFVVQPAGWLSQNSGIANRIAALEGTEFASLQATPSVVEYGQNATPSLTWVIDSTATLVSQTVNGDAVDVADRAWTASAAITDDTTYTVEVTDTIGRDTSEAVTVDFRHRAFWGASPSATLDAAGVLALTDSGLINDPAQSLSVDATGGNYVFYAYPALYGLPDDVRAFGFSVTTVNSVANLTTSAGFTATYRIIRLPNLLDGVIEFEVI